MLEKLPEVSENLRLENVTFSRTEKTYDDLAR